MVNSIPPILPPGPVAPQLPPQGVSSGEAAGGFASVLEDAVSRVEQYQTESHNAIGRFLSGEEEDLHTVALATQRAELSFELFLQMKNKVVQAYQEIMRMQV